MLLDGLARLGLSPLLIAQALQVRRRAQSLPEAAGPRTGSTGQGPPLRLRLIGDSSGAGVGVTHQDQALIGQIAHQLAPHFTLHWHLDAQTGATTSSTLDRLAAAQSQACDVIVLALGVNDITRLIPPNRWLGRQTQLLQRLRALYRPTRIYVSGIPPVGRFPLLPQPLRWTLGRQAQAYDTRQRHWAEAQPDVTLMPFDQPLDPALMASDGFHPGAEIYALWAKEIASRILSDWR